jgi:hypothetical protein
LRGCDSDDGTGNDASQHSGQVSHELNNAYCS